MNIGKEIGRGERSLYIKRWCYQQSIYNSELTNISEYQNKIGAAFFMLNFEN